MEQAGYTSYRDPRLQPPDEPAEEPVDVMDRCVHCAACQHVWLNHIDARKLAGWEDEMARELGCEFCELWKED